MGTEYGKKIMLSNLVFVLLVGLSYGFQYKNVTLRQKYDYVVVGGGSAGAVVASGLSENGQNSVLLIEAGGPPPAMSEVPIFFQKLSKTNMEVWYHSEPQQNACLGLPESRCFWRIARGLGGGSSHNHMMFMRGNRNDFDNWERLGAKGWNYKSVLQVFKKIENHTDPEIRNNGYHGTKGLLTVSPIRYKTDLGHSFLEAGRTLGMKRVDYNGASQEGNSFGQVSQRDGLRCSTEKAFLRPAAHRPNLDILTHAFVLKVTFDDQKRVKEVHFDHQNTTKVVEVGKEVVISAGTLSSPKILMLSGIGPKEHLQEMKIPVVVDLPGVGQNFHDHPYTSHLNFLLNDSVGIVYKRDVNEETVGEILEGKGPLTSPGFTETMAFLNTKYQNRSEEWPDLLIITGSTALSTYTPELYVDKNATGMIAMVNRPKSRGFVKLRSTNPYDNVIAQPNYFSVRDDLNRYVEGVKIALSLIQTPALQRYNPQQYPKVNGCEDFDTYSDEFAECALTRFMIGGTHPVGTCKMGDPRDKTTVVSPELKVLGVKGLRVADASIMPAVTSGTTNAPSIMIGQKAVDMMVSDPDFKK